MRIIDKQGPLYNPADRDHCIQYMTAVGLINGESDCRRLRGRGCRQIRASTSCASRWSGREHAVSRDYLDPDKRSIANAVQVFFKDGTATEQVAVEYPIGHRRRRAEGLPLLVEKFEGSLKGHYSEEQAEKYWMSAWITSACCICRLINLWICGWWSNR